MRLSFFFGAGAEISYGLPSGATFALELFKQSSKTSLKEDFKISLEKIDERSFYAKNWLPDDFKKRRVTFFSKKDYSQLIESSLESGGEKAISFFRNMDEVFVDIISNQSEDKVKALFFEEFQEDVGYKYGEKTKINQVLCGDDGGILDSVYYSALLKIIEKKVAVCIKNMLWHL